MRKTLLAMCTLLACISSNAYAADQSDMEFDQGTVLIRCMAPEGHAQISTDLFNAGFPYWITNLRKMADDGLIRRVHYLGVLRDGLFIVIEAKTREEALEKSTVVINDINAVMRKAIADTGEQPTFDQNDACQFIEIGPVAILPKK